MRSSISATPGMNPQQNNTKDSSSGKGFEKWLQDCPQDVTVEMLGMLQENMKQQQKRKDYLSKHENVISQCPDGRWRTQINGRDVKKKNRTDLEDEIVKYYETIKSHQTFPQVFEKWISEKAEFEEIRCTSITRYRTDFRRFFPPEEAFCKIDLQELTDSDLERFIKHSIRSHELTAKTYSGLRILLIGVLKYAKREGYTSYLVGTFFQNFTVPNNLFKKVPPKNSAEEVFSVEEEKLLLDDLRSQKTLLNLGLELMFISGLRVGELSALRWKDFDTVRKTISVSSTEIQYEDSEGHRIVTVSDMPKTDAACRDVTLPDSAMKVIRKIRESVPFSAEFVFTRKNGARIRSKNFNEALKRACRRVQIPVRTTHKIRKTYASTLIDAGVNCKIIQSQLGHKDFLTTKRYYDFDRLGETKKAEEINRAICI